MEHRRFLAHPGAHRPFAAESMLPRAGGASAIRTLIEARARQLALALVNEVGRPSALRAQPHGTCLRYEPASEALVLARRGDVAVLGQLLSRAPDVLGSAPHAARLLHLAVFAGRSSAVELLLEQRLGSDLQQGPLAQTSPAVDALEITPVHHAVAGGQSAALHSLLECARRRNEPLRGARRALREASARERLGRAAKSVDRSAIARLLKGAARS